MAKIMAMQSIKNDSETKENKVPIIKNNNTLSFLDDKTFMKLIINEEEATIIRENDSMYVELYFSSNKEKMGYYKLKETNTSMDMKVITQKLIVLDHKIEIEYKLYIEDEYVDSVSYKLEWSD